MKIEKINLPFEITSQVELKAIKMERLSNVVLIAGKNGSGKSRLLKLIKSQVPHIPNNEKISKLKTDLSRYKEHITQQEKQIQNIDSRLGKGLIKKEEIDPSGARLQRVPTSLLTKIKRLQRG
jgi:ABC-type cobalamin/Fe3+-siderophores transport system ATPase subunit